jgi:hypothetical protein
VISFLIPYRAENAYRSTSLDYVRGQLLQGWEPGEIEVLIEDSPTENFNRSAARNAAAKKAQGDVLVFVDADSCVPLRQMKIAFDLLGKVGAQWVLPYDRYYSLTEGGTKAHMLGDTPAEYEHCFPSVETPEPAVGGGIVVSRVAFEVVHGYDERFIGWGEEDRAFYMALETLAPHWTRIQGPLYHLWHPADESVRFEQPHFEDNRRLCNRYRCAVGNKPLMAALVAEH